MFDLTKQEEANSEPMLDLEKRVKNEKEYRQLQELVTRKKQRVTEMLRKGESKDDFGKLGVLLYGYDALQTILKTGKEKTWAQ